jgi:hypothetical protein
MTYEFSTREMCAIVITKAIRADVKPMVHFIQELRRQGFDDLEVGRLFTETAMIIFGETWPEDKPDTCDHEYCLGNDHCVYSPEHYKENEEPNETTSDSRTQGESPETDSEQDLLRPVGEENL